MKFRVMLVAWTVASSLALAEQGCPSLTIAKTWNDSSSAGIVDFKNQNCTYSADNGSSYNASGDWSEAETLKGTNDNMSGKVAINIRNNNGTAGPQKGSYGPCPVSIVRSDVMKDQEETYTKNETQTVTEPDPNDPTKTISKTVTVAVPYTKTVQVKVANRWQMDVTCPDNALVEHLYREEAVQ